MKKTLKTGAVVLLITAIIGVLNVGVSAQDSAPVTDTPSSEFSFEVGVKIGTDGEWQSDISAVNPQIGDTLRFRMYYQNTGSDVQNSVVFSAELKSGLEYVNGSTVIHDLFGSRAAETDAIVTSGVNLGNYESLAEVYVIFEATVTGTSIEALFSVDTDDGGQDVTLSYDGIITPAPSSMFSLDVGVKIGTDGEWQNDISAVNPQVGDTLRFRMRYENIGNTNQYSVVFSSELRSGLEYIAGSTVISDSFGIRNAQHDSIASTGLSLGSFAHGAGGELVFEARVTNVSAINALFAIDTDYGRLERTLEYVGNSSTSGDERNPSTGVTLGFPALLLTVGIAAITRKRK